MEKRYGILILGTFACAACFLLSACAGPAAEQSSVQPPYDGQTQDADVFIDMPNLRQYGGYTCGTTCVQMVMNWLDPYQADWNLAAYEEELGTNEEAGTPPGSIVSFFEENSVTVTAKENRTTPELASALYQGHPVLLCIQAWAAAEDGYNTQNSDDADTYLAEGHWVICVVTDLSTIAEYGRRGVLALLADSTNAERPGFTATEQTVAEGVRSLFARAKNRRIIVATFASNIYRIQQIIDLAIEYGRKVAVNGRSMVSNTEMARELGYLHAPDNVLIDIEEINKYPPEKVVLITTGSQGEPLSALSRMAQASHRTVKVGPTDFIIISARPIPGNEKTVTKVVNGLLALGAEVIYENMYDTHVSGHACQEEQKLMLTLAHPQYFLPVHGEFKQLKRHAETAEHLGYIPKQNIYIAENGQNIRLSRDGMAVEGTVPAGAVMVDGYGVGDVGNVVLRDRHHLSEDGIIIVTAAVDGSTGQLLSGPDLVSRGFVYVRESEELMDGARVQVEMALDRSMADNMHDWASVKSRVREALSSYIYRKTKRSPMILPILMEV